MTVATDTLYSKHYPATNVPVSVWSEAITQLAKTAMTAHSTGMLLDGSACATNLATNTWSLLGVGARHTLSWSASTRHFLLDATPYSVPEGASALDALHQLLEAHSSKPSSLPEGLPQDFPFCSGWLGLLQYEATSLFEPAYTATPVNAALANPVWPDLFWFVPKTVWVFHHPSQQAWLLSEAGKDNSTLKALWPNVLKQNATLHEGEHHELEHALPAKTTAPNVAGLLSKYQASLSPEAFKKNVSWLQQQIRQGECFQANLSVGFERPLNLPVLPKELFKETALESTGWGLFEQLTRSNPSPFAALFKTPYGTLVSNSPERLVEVNINGLVQTRPIAGTRGRGATQEEEMAIADTLLNSPKELAEHAMLVDLERNDLGRVCSPGSVYVNELLSLERYSHVTHLVSNVQGQLAETANCLQVLAATFPGGTITGCPKVRCMHLLAQAEPTPRGFYTGSLGYLDWHRQRMDWSILIRTLALQSVFQNTNKPSELSVRFQAGAGIVLDSVPEHEYKEALRKAAAMAEAVAFVESL